MKFLELAIESNLPLIYVRTDDPIHAEEVLTFLNKKQAVAAIALPEVLGKGSEITWPEPRVLYTSDNCKSLAKLYRLAVDAEKTIVFINTEKSVLQLDGGMMIPPKELVLEFLTEMGVEEPQELMPAFGGMTLKDIGEVAKMTMTRDESLTVVGINTTRRGYNKLQGITQVDTEQAYYLPATDLVQWMDSNTMFFKEPKHPSLTPRGILLDGPPGTGKTEGSKYIARNFGVPLYRLDLGAMMGKYVGESEGNLLAALSQIDQVEPAVVILDEVEKVFTSQSDSGVTSRLLSQMLWWLQDHKSKIFTVMTTNNVGTIPVELYREGRVDKVLKFLGVTGKTEGYNFAKGAFDQMMKELEYKPTANDYAALQKRIGALYSDSTPVPQSKLTVASNSLVREILSGVKSVVEDAPAPAPSKTGLKLLTKKAV